MKRLALGLWLLGTTALRASNPDGSFALSGAFVGDLSGPSETGRARTGSLLFEDQQRALGSSSAGMALSAALCDALTLVANGGYSAYASEFKGSLLSGASGSFVSRSDGHDSFAGAGFRLYPGAFFLGDYDPQVQPNPDGFVHWPSVLVALTAHRGEEQSSNSAVSGIYAGGGVGKSGIQLSYQEASYAMVLPVAQPLSLTLGYSRQLARHQDFDLAGAQSSSSDDGAFESLEGTLTFFTRLKASPTTGPLHYVPHGGLPGMLRVDFNYGQAYDLVAGQLSTRSYQTELSYALEGGLGVSLLYGFRETVSSLLPPGEEATQVNQWAQDLGLQLSYGWNAWKRPGHEAAAPE